jgi:cyclic pyranopterin phosphate synthase
MGGPIPVQVVEAPRDTLSRPLRDLRISVIDRCNFRCPYCMPEDQFAEDSVFLSKSDVLPCGVVDPSSLLVVELERARAMDLVAHEARSAVDQMDTAALRRIPGVNDLALTTNGVLLPRLATALREAGLMRLTVSLDTLDGPTFHTLSGGRGEVGEVLAGIAAAEAAGFDRIKLNCVVMRGVNDSQVLDLLERFRGTRHVVRFIEYMDVGTLNHWRGDLVVPSAELIARIDARWPLRALERNYRGEVAERHEFVDGGGELGFIGSVSQPFCGDCSRARLSADGRMYTCLFARDGHDLRTLLRGGSTDEELAAAIAGHWTGRGPLQERRAEMRGTGDDRKVEMFTIGGWKNWPGR